MYRPDLSCRPESFNLAKTRYRSAGTYRVELGKQEDFTNCAKAYCILGYQVVAGAAAGTYLFFDMMDSMRVLDGEPERQALRKGIGADNFDRMMKSTGDIFASIEDTLFEVKPGMSYAA